MLEQGKITKIKGNRAYVEIKKKPECQSCKACVFGKNSSVLVGAIANIRCSIGDTVTVEMPDASILCAPVLLYAAPLLFMLLGAYIGSFISTVMQVVFGFMLLLVSLLGVYLIDKLYFRKKPKYSAIITSVLSKHETEATSTIDCLNS